MPARALRSGPPSGWAGTRPKWFADFTQAPRWLRLPPTFDYTAADGTRHTLEVPRFRSLGLDVHAENRMVRALRSPDSERDYHGRRPARGGGTPAVHALLRVDRHRGPARAGEVEPAAGHRRRGGARLHLDRGRPRDEIKVEHFYPPTFVALPPRRPAAPARPLPEWAAELLELIGKHLDLPSFIAFHVTCRAVHDKTLTLQAHLLELSQVTQVVSRELERLRDPARRTQAPPWTAQELQRVTAAFDDPLIRGTPAAHDVMQRGLGRALHRWAGQLASNLLLHRVPLAVALPQMLQQAGHLPDAVLAMAAPRLVQIFAMAPALLASMAGFVDALYTLDRQRPQPPGCAAADLAAGLSAAAGSDAANQQLVHAFLQDAAQRPPVFEATALTWLLWAVAHVGPPEDTQDPLLPPAQRRTELYDDIVARYRLLPDDLKPGPRRWLEDRIRLLPRVDRARREAHLATL